MADQILDPDGARERLAAWKGRIDQLAADTKAMSDRLQVLQETVSDPRGMTTVTVDSTGTLIGLQLTPRIREVPPEVVAQTVMETVRRAKTRLADRSREIIEETVGTETAAGRAIADSVGRHLRADDQPDHVGPEPAPSSPQPRASALRDDDDDEPFELKL